MKTTAAENLELRLQRAETLVRIAAEVSFDQPLDDLFRVLARNIATETRAIAAGLVLLNRSDLSPIATGGHNLPEGYLEGVVAGFQSPDRARAVRNSLAGERTNVVRNVRTTMLGQPEYESIRDILERVPFETVVTTPFLRREETVGFVGLYYAAGDEIDDEEVAFARDIAARAAPVMDNAWLFKEFERRSAELEALARADQALHQSLVLDDVFRALIDLAVDLFGADRSMFLSWDETDHLHAFVARGVPDEELARLQEVYHRIPRGDGAAASPDIRVMEDVQGSARVHPGVRTVTTSASAVDIPVEVNGEVFGVFVLGYHARRVFNENDRRMFRTLASRAGVAIENALLFGESQRRGRELEALHRADEALNQSLALDDVLNAMTNLAVDLFGAESSLVAGFGDDDHLRVVSARGLEPDIFEIVNASYSRFDRAHFEQLPRPIRSALIPDAAADERLSDDIRTHLAGSIAEIPVFTGGAVWGIFSIGWSRPRLFSEADRQLFDAFSARASLAIQNANLFQESQRRTQELEALYRADEALHQSLALDDVLKAMTDLAIELLGAESSLVATFGDDDRLGVVISRGLEKETFEIINDGYKRLDRARVARAPQPMRIGITEDVHTDPRVDERLRNRAVGSVAEIPVVVGGETWGFFSIGWERPRRFSEDEQRMFDAFSARASLAIQNAILFEQAQRSASLEERQRIARELHDSVSQALYGIGLGARTLRRRLGAEPDRQIAEPVEYIAGLAEGGLAETRALIFELIPNSLETDGLTTALQRQAAATQARHQVTIEVVVSDEPDIPIRAKEALYRIAQESLGNVAKHAEATNARVTLETADGSVVLRIADNGRGFDPSGDFPGHFGLRSMAERAARVGASYLVESAPGEGATVTVRLPG